MPVTMSDPEDIFARLMAVIEDRISHPRPSSYTCRLLAGGIEKIGDKICEEAAELVAAAHQVDASARAHIVRESADLIFHLMVLLAHRGIGWQQVGDELARRFGTSGLEEKASRKKSETPGDADRSQ